MSSPQCLSCGLALSPTAQFCSRCGTATGFAPPTVVDWQQPNNQSYNQNPYVQPPPYNQQYQQPYQDPYQQPYQQPPNQQNYAPYQQPFYQQPPPFNQAAYGAAPVPGYYRDPKSKAGAILLAIFFGGWTWVYTYKKDSWKFWLSLALTITLFNPLWTWVILFLPNLGLYIWAIVDTISKSQQWYDNYPML